MSMSSRADERKESGVWSYSWNRIQEFCFAIISYNFSYLFIQSLYD